MQLTGLQPQHVDAVAAIHARALAGDFLPSLGIPFLRTFYRAALESDAAFGFVQLDGETPVGFVLGSADTGALFRRVLRSAWLRLGWAALPAVLRRPALLAKVAETFLYPGREAASEVNAELVVIAVEPQYRGQRLGEALVAALSEALRSRGLPAYKVTVLQANEGANRFYRRLGFCLASTFKLYGKGWNLYTLSLAEKLS